jgi:hypothetical protein
VLGSDEGEELFLELCEEGGFLLLLLGGVVGEDFGEQLN